MPSEFTSGLLVAAPALLDPNFKQAVVLLTAHRPEGSLGFVVNRPSGLSFKEVVSELGIGAEDHEAPDLPVLIGGPVAPETGWLVFDPTDTCPEGKDNVLEVSDGLHISTSREFLESIAKSDCVDRHMLVLGYAGWGAGQLDGEIQQGVWIPVDLDEAILFDTAPEDRWNGALVSLGIDPMHLVSTPIADA